MHGWLQGVVVSDRRCCVQFDSGGVVACERRSDTDASRPGKAVTIEFIFGGGGVWETRQRRRRPIEPEARWGSWGGAASHLHTSYRGLGSAVYMLTERFRAFPSQHRRHPLEATTEAANEHRGYAVDCFEPLVIIISLSPHFCALNFV